MAAGVRPRVFTFLSAASPEEKQGVLVNLAASLMRVGSDVMVVDACSPARGIVSRLGAQPAASLLEVARGERNIEQAIRMAQQGYQYAALTGGVSPERSDADALNEVFARLQRHVDVLMADAELDAQGALPVAGMEEGEIVVQVANHPESIKQAYLLVKQLNSQVGRRSFGVLVTGASEKEAQRVYANLAQTASRYLAVELRLIGAVPADEHLHRAVRLERPVVEAFPLAAASVAFRQIAGWLAQQGSPASKRGSWMGQEAGLVMAGA
jgi:flagellar biosynthesis protein FlhG